MLPDRVSNPGPLTYESALLELKHLLNKLFTYGLRCSLITKKSILDGQCFDGWMDE